jgi:hypothetical protein
MYVSVLKTVFPIEAQYQEAVITKYKELWDDLNKYVHPTGELMFRMLDDSALYIRDAFDREWALEIIGAAVEVFDFIWFAALLFHLDALDLVRKRKLHGKYHTLDQMLKP